MANQKSNSGPSSPSSSQPSPLVFVNVTDPAAIDSQSVRRLVRSSATRHSHRDPNRKPKARKADRSAGASSHIASPKHCTNSGRSSPDENESTPALQLPPSLFTHEDRQKVANLIDQLVHDSEADLRTAQIEQLSASQPNNSYPVDAEEWFPWVLSYYRTTYLPLGIVILQTTQEDGDHFIEWFIRQGNSEPALFYMQLLTACTQLVDGNQVPQSHVDWLRDMVVRSINEAISDAIRTSSVATMLAVALISLHERIYGDKALAMNVHGKAFATMLELRGGVTQMQLPRIAWGLLLWVDMLVTPGAKLDQIALQLLEVWVSAKWRPSHPD